MRRGIKFSEEEKKQLLKESGGTSAAYDNWSNYVFLRGAEAGYKLFTEHFTTDQLKMLHKLVSIQLMTRNLNDGIQIVEYHDLYKIHDILNFFLKERL